MISEKDITEALKNELLPLTYVYAFWLEGSFAMGYADEYSDIDYWIDVEDNHVKDALEHIETALCQFGELDSCHENDNSHPKLGQMVYHIKNLNSYLVIDFNWQMHSRNRNEYHYIKDDVVEGALVVFDKDKVVRFEELNLQEITDNRLNCRQECDYRYSQHLRVTKYIKRGTFPEAYAYYNRYVIEPLVILLRLKYTPIYPHHYLLHISQHMPREVVRRLEPLIQITSLEMMEATMTKAQVWYQELVNELYD